MLPHDGEMILLAIDKAQHRSVLAELLNPEGYRIVFAASAEELLNRAQSKAPDLVLIDSELPAAGGFAACQSLHKIPALAETPVLMITSDGDPAQAFRFGARDAVEWPIRPDVLLARVGTQVSLYRARRLLAARNREYEHLLHVLCHDLWNPIAAMRGFIRIARLPEEDGEPRSLRSNLEDCLQHQENIIERVRELRAHDTGKLKRGGVPVPLGDAIQSAGALVMMRYREKDVRLDLPSAETLQGKSVWCDPVGLTHGVLCNLLTNALKFSEPRGTVSVEAEFDAGACTILVRDHGVGIPRSLLPRLFQLDYATSRPGTAGERGTGFGLPLVWRVLERCGGSITLESQDILESPDSHGTTARVRLGLVPGAGAAELNDTG